MRRAPRRSFRTVPLLAVLLVLALVGPASGPARASPPLPLVYGRGVLSNLTAPSVGPGGSSAIALELANPGNFTMVDVRLTLGLYEFNGYPGDSVGALPVANPPLLSNASASGLSVGISVAALAPGASVYRSIGFQTSAATPAGTYAVRTAVAFQDPNGTSYLLESRGWFSAGQWANATELPGGNATLNLTVLGVSGVVPETAIYVAPSGWPVALAVLVAGGLALVGVGAWVYFRKGPGSRSGAGKLPAPGATNAPSAFGRSRSSPGDSRSS